jgi:hypothetical protein
MPFDVAVEERDAWIVDFETYDGVATAVDEHGVATHRRFRNGNIRRWKKWWTVVGAGAGARDYLEVVRVQMEWMSTAIEVYNCEFDDCAEGQDVGVAVHAVDFGVVD